MARIFEPSWGSAIRLVLVSAPMMIGASLAAAANRSVYTPLDVDRCTMIERIEEGESIRWRCPGHAGIPLFVNAGDGRFDLDAGVDNGVWESLPAFNNLGPRVEWRLRGGRPFAVIFRLTEAQRGIGEGDRLAVETIGRDGRPGCQVALIDARRRDANAEARRRADALPANVRCPAPND